MARLETSIDGVYIDTNAISKELIDQLPSDHMERFTVPPKTVKFNPPSPEDRWIIIDNTYPEQIEQRLRLLQLYPDYLIASMDGQDVEKANKELKDNVVEYVMDTYPDYFSLNNKFITSHLSGLSIKINHKRKAEDLITTSLLVTEDMPMMMPDEPNEVNGHAYRLKSGTLLFGYHWSLISQFNEPAPKKHQNPRLWKQWNVRKQSSHATARLGDTSEIIHMGVPEYQKKHIDGVERYFNNVAPNQLHCRSNWLIDTSDRLCQHPDITEDHAEGISISPDNLYMHGYIRSERQSFRKLEKSKAVVFGIKTYNWKISDIFNSPKAFEALDLAEKNLSPAMRQYKDGEYQPLRELIDMHKANKIG